MTAVAEIAAERFVSVTTYRRSGAGVGVPTELQAMRGRLRDKYGIEYWAITVLEKVVGVVRRRDTSRVVIRISPTTT